MIFPPKNQSHLTRKVASFFAKKYDSKNGADTLLHLLENCSNSPFIDLNSQDKKDYCKNVALSIAKTTWSSYKTALKHYKKLEGKIWPFSSILKNKFSNLLLAEKCSVTTIKTYLAGISFFNNFLGFKNSDLDRANILNLRGISNSKNNKKTHFTHPISFKILKFLRSSLKKKFKNKLKFYLYWTACTLAFFGSLRLKEIFSSFKNATDLSSDLLWTDIYPVKRKAIKLKIKHPKINPATPIFIIIFPFPNKKLCPIKNLEKLKKLQKKKQIFSSNHSFLCYKKGKFLTAKKFVKVIKNSLKHSKYKKLHFSARSFRAGIPSEMESYPHLFNDLHSKNWGRWKSKSYQLYMKKDFSQKEWIFKRLISILK